MKILALSKETCPTCYQRLSTDDQCVMLGQQCGRCRHNRLPLVTLDHVDLMVTAGANFDYRFAGTRLLVNRRVATLVRSMADWSTFRYCDDTTVSIRVGFHALNTLLRQAERANATPERKLLETAA